MSSSPNGLRLGTSLFSLTNAFYSRRYSLEELIARVAELRLGPGLEMVGFQSIRGFPQVTEEFAGHFRELLSRHGLEPSCLGTNADVALRRDRRMNEDESVAYHEAQIRAAAKLGFPVTRVQIGAGTAVLRRLVPLAEQVQVKLGIEIHAPQGVDTPEVLEFREMYEEVDSPFLGFVPDFGACARGVPNGLVERARKLGASDELVDLALGIWHGEGEQKGAEFRERASRLGEDPAAVIAIGIIFNILGRKDPQSWKEIMPQVVHLHGKFYEFDAAGNETSIPYDELIPVFRDGGYSGYLSNEWEGTIFSDEDGFEEIQKHHALCRRILERGTAARPEAASSGSTQN
jgi:sugar phosphate isomerase/epimerase